MCSSIGVEASTEYVGNGDIEIQLALLLVGSIGGPLKLALVSSVVGVGVEER